MLFSSRRNLTGGEEYGIMIKTLENEEKMNKLKKIGELWLTFMKIGLFTFGGGYAMISLIEDECIEKKKWITHDDMMNVTVIAESTPGPIAINCATYIGYRQAGFLGSVAATIGVVLPSFVILFVISKFLDRFLEIGWIANAFRGIKAAVGILILNAAVNMIKKAKKAPLSLTIFGVCFALMMLVNVFAWNFSTVTLILIVAVFSLLFHFLFGRKGDGEK